MKHCRPDAGRSFMRFWARGADEPYSHEPANPPTSMQLAVAPVSPEPPRYQLPSRTKVRIWSLDAPYDAMYESAFTPVRKHCRLGVAAPSSASGPLE